MEIAFGLAVAGLIGLLIADSKGRDKVEGCALGCLLGPIGWLIEGFLPAEGKEETEAAAVGQEVPGTASDSTVNHGDRPRQKCPYCAEVILVEAKICKHCGREVELDESGQEQSERENLFCPACDAPIVGRAEECPKCGYDADHFFE